MQVELAPALAEAPPARLVTLRPTMSKAGLLLACQWPWGKTVRPREIGEDANYGSAFHELAAQAVFFYDSPGGCRESVRKAAKKYNIDPRELGDHFRQAWPILYDWIKGGNPWRADLSFARARTELPIAYDVRRKKARIIALPTVGTHEYRDAEPHELPGTADLIFDAMPDKYRAKGVPHFIVVDHKTGEFCDLPQESVQLKTIALAYDSIVSHKRTIAGVIFHATRGGPATVYSHVFEPKELRKTRLSLVRALARIGDGSLSPGRHCAICPAMTICPAHTSGLAKLGDTNLSTMTAERLGAQHEAVQLLGKYLDRWREDARAWIRENGPGIRPDGQLVNLVEKDVERVSKKNVVEVEGAAKAEKVFAEWRQKGYLKTETQEELRAVKDG